MERDTLSAAIHTLRRAEVERYETQVKEYRESSVRLEAMKKRREAQLRELMRASNVNIDRIEQTEKESREERARYLKEIRPVLADREPDPNLNLQKARLIDALGQGRRTLNVAAATLLASESRFLEGNPGEKGNPWVFPWNPDRQRIFIDFPGDGSGCFPHGQRPPTVVTFWYVFTPNRRATWTLWPTTALEGFYILQADDGILSCKSATVSIDIEMDVYQYFWHGIKHETLVNRGGDNIDVGQRFDRIHTFDYRTDLAPGSGAWEDNAFVRVTVSIWSDASGDGSYAEVNFADGSGNYIEPIVLTVFSDFTLSNPPATQ